MIICVTGESGSGKSTFAKLLAREMLYKYIDVDDIVHRMYKNKKMINKFIDLFGSEIVENGKVSRKLVGQIALKSKDGFDRLNTATWEYIENKIDNLIKRYKNVVIDYKFLPITKYFKMPSCNILVKADKVKRIVKIKERDGLKDDYISLRDSYSPNYENYTFEEIVFNDYLTDFKENIKKIKEIVR